MQSCRRNHPEKAQLESFMRCKLPRAEVRTVVRHLLTNCPQCVVLTSHFWRLGEWPKALQILLQEAARQERRAARHRRGLREADGL